MLLTCLLLSLYTVSADECAAKISQERSMEAKLSQDLQARCPEGMVFAPSPLNNTVVTLKFTLKDFLFDDGEEMFGIYCWLFLSWNNSNYSWDPKDYGDIDKLQITTDSAWTPTLHFQHSNAMDHTNQLSSQMCVVLNTGQVQCKTNIFLSIRCVSKLRDWPYDTQSCRYEFQSKKHLGIQPVFKFDGRAMTMLGAEYGAGWNIVDYEQGQNVSAEVPLFVQLKLERQAMALGVILIYPIIAMVVLNVTVLFTDIRGSIRLLLNCLSLLSHFFFLQLINYSIPQHNPDTPTILIYTRTSLIITGFTLVLSLILNNMTKINKAPPHWITCINTWLLNTPIRYAIEASSVGRARVTESVSKINNNEWKDFANLVNAFYVVIIVIFYLVIYNMYIPRQY